MNKVWLVWESSHEEIAVVCATEVIARQWVKDKVEEKRKEYRIERARRIALRSELRAMPWQEQLQVMGISGGEPTKYTFTNPDFYDPDTVTEAGWPMEEAQVLGAEPWTVAADALEES